MAHLSVELRPEWEGEGRGQGRGRQEAEIHWTEMDILERPFLGHFLAICLEILGDSLGFFGILGDSLSFIGVPGDSSRFPAISRPFSTICLENSWRFFKILGDFMGFLEIL